MAYSVLKPSRLMAYVTSSVGEQCVSRLIAIQLLHDRATGRVFRNPMSASSLRLLATPSQRLFSGAHRHDSRLFAAIQSVLLYQKRTLSFGFSGPYCSASRPLVRNSVLLRILYLSLDY